VPHPIPPRQPNTATVKGDLTRVDREMSRVVVFDNGGGTIKAGWGGDAAPSIVVPNVAARIKRQQRLLLADETETNVKGV
jgi:actin-related protein